jgi:tRNA(Ile)-lysidine synthase
VVDSSAPLITDHWSPITAEEFAAAMAPLGPFEAAPRLAVGVSGGADSMALALLAAGWVRERDGSLVALIVDHGLRAESAQEAAAAAARLAEQCIASRLLRIDGLARGSALAERAREARFAVLAEACAAEGILHLLLGHHAADQAETVLMRSLGGSGPGGLAGISPLIEAGGLRLLRPLLSVPPLRLRATLAQFGVAWSEDPSNADAQALRPRLRRLRGDRDGTGSATAALVAAAAASGRLRARNEAALADWLAGGDTLRPEGFAVLAPGPMPPAVLAAVIQTIAGARYPPPTDAVTALAAAPKSATLAGVRLLPAGRMGQGWLLVREAAAMSSPVPALPGAVWDGRFRLAANVATQRGVILGALGANASGLRRVSRLPAAVLRTLPALRRGERLLAVPHLNYPDSATCAQFPIIFSPLRPAAAAPFAAAGEADAIGDASTRKTPYVGDV